MAEKPYEPERILTGASIRAVLEAKAAAEAAKASKSAPAAEKKG